ncbi:MAG: selenide, water dikinase SelD [Phycisphaerae bacterium]|nr:selenide, water dikinase SelD [Phycisphaerae bacterium]NIP51392.1 selenide, water dikinase SelD [Phycisphaerae bacterium]NIS50591.1 selenide, water dikinase SelD [Phycisphaerae bacterium]NIU08330.1 selenide, water dikinase SelD [Phycisphaerae bacterium]NIU55822.1 selenide, water dikinase SelD [Phycisphaerae bacterium]
MKNMERRKRVMQRSIRLGHCICDPKKPCPCDLFKEKDICLCSGERLESPTGPVQLTSLVEKAGCASKIDQAFLKQILTDLPTFDDPRVLVGVPAGDDAGIYDMGGGTALVQTVDVFTPSVDDPYVFGQVAAANSVSDIYAMGGRPMTAVSVIGFPARMVPDKVMHDILCGGIDKMKEAVVAIIGGHSINDSQLKAGFAVTGTIEKDKIVTNSRAREGDVLVLTKPLGTGIVAFAAQIGRAKQESIEASAKSMTSLNKKASELMVKFKAHACTDVTGFSLLGHLTEMALKSGVDAEIIWDELPLLAGVPQYAADGILPGAIERNKESCSARVVPADGLKQEMLDICYDAQTSGGLLIAIAENAADDFLKALHSEGVAEASVVGKVLGKGSGLVHVRTTGKREMPAPSQEKPAAKAPVVTQEVEQVCCAEPEVEETACCADGHGTGTAVSGDKLGTSEIQRKFQEFLKSANTPGALDAYTKQAVALSLSVLAKCEPCVKMHIKKARKMGFSQEEIDEAAWMGIAFGGSPVMMFYNGVKNS